MGGLYQRALYIRTQEELLKGTGQGLTFDEESGIPIEEQKEILSQIENVISDNKITLTKESQIIKPQKKGFLFPFLNFILTLVVAAGVFFFFQQNFISREKDIALRADSRTRGDDLLKQIQRDADSQLQDKEREIEHFQQELANLDQKQVELKEQMDADIAARKGELELEMKQAIDREIADLKAQGISTEDIDAQLKALEEEENRKLAIQLKAYEDQKNEERQKSEEALSQMKTDYQKSLDKADEDKKRIKDDADRKLKEAEERRQQEIEEQRIKEEALSTEIKEAKNQLEVLTEQRQKEENINSMISGYYNSIKVNLEEENYPTAQANIEKMEAVFNQEDIMDLPGIAERRQRELLVINLMKRLINSEANKPTFDTESVLSKANTLTQVSTKVQTAEELYKDGKFEEAQDLYEEALGIIPDIKESYFKNVEIDNTKQQELYTRYVSAGNAQFTKGDYEDAVKSYKSAIKVIPENAASVDKVLANILEAGYNMKGDNAEKEKEDTQSELILSRADIFYSTGAHSDAVDKYLEILTLYPRSDRVEKAKTGIKNSIAELQNIQKSIIDENTGTIEKLNTAIVEKEETISSLEAAIEEKNSKLVEKETNLKSREVDNLNTKLAEQVNLLTEKNNELVQLKALENTLNTKISDLESQVAELSGQLTEKAVTTKKIIVKEEVISEEDQQKLDEFETLKENIESVRDRFNNYSLEEDTAIETMGTVGYLTTRPQLGEILNSGVVSDIMPGLYKRINDYETALTVDAKADGSYLAIDTVLTIIDQRLNLPKNTSPGEFWEKMRKEYKDDDIFLDLINELEYLKDK